MIFEKLFAGDDHGTITLGELRVIFERVREVCTLAGGSKVAARDLAMFSAMLETHAARTVGEFCASTGDALKALTDKPKGRRKGSRTPIAANEDAIRLYVVGLREAGTDRTAFEHIFAKLKTDKSVKSRELGEIARQYSLSITRYKSIAAARSDIEKAFVRQARFENKIR